MSSETELKSITTCNCANLITHTAKILKNGNTVEESNFHCAKKRISREDTRVINEAFQRQTQISVAGYTCYYQHNDKARLTDCPKFEELK
jgi:hypothetical protein